MTADENNGNGLLGIAYLCPFTTPQPSEAGAQTT